MTPDTWLDIARMMACLAILYAGVAPLMLVGGTVTTAAKCFVVLTPAVLVVHGFVNAAFLAFGADVQEHPLATDTPAPLWLVLQACVLAPLAEELIFRGAVLWGLRLVGEWLSWAVLAAAVGVAAGSGVGPGVFAGLLAVGWLGARRRVDRGVYASAALFAAVHSGVWPTPIPLFALGLGLGWVAARTNGLLAPFLVHGLFNAVSVLFVLSGAAK